MAELVPLKDVPKQKMYEKGMKEKNARQNIMLNAQAVLANAKAAQVQLASKLTKTTNLLKDKATYRTDREMNLQHFRELLSVFESASNSDEGGNLSLGQFKKAFSNVLGENLTDEQLNHLFMKIDANTDNYIDWDDFSTFMLMRAEGQKKMKEEAENQLFEIEPSILHRIPLPTPHKDLIGIIIFLPHVRKYLTCSRDGTITYWSDRLKVQRTFKQVGSQTSMESGDNSKLKRVNRWIHECRYLASFSKLIMASDDHCITFNDFATLSCDIKVDIGEAVPLTLDVWYDPENTDTSETMLVIGTDAGQVILLQFLYEELQQYTKSKGNIKNTIDLDAFARNHKTTSTLTKRNAHSDWCVKVRYYPGIRSIISCSADPKESLVVATHNKNKWTYNSLPVHKGVNTFAYCTFPAVLVTGGTDRQLRIWNAHRLHHPMAALKGHNSPIIDIAINEISGQIISLSTDKVVKIWDIRRQNCVQTLVDSYQYRPENVLSCIHFSPAGGGKLLLASYTLIPYQLQQKQVSFKIPTSHDFPLRAAIYNGQFKQIVSGCDGGVVNVWDLLTGQKTFRLPDVNDGSEEITAMTFDLKCRRLITGGRAGTLRIWNFNNGQRLHELKGDNSEVTGIMYLEMKGSNYILTTGWSRRITMFLDDEDEYYLYPAHVWPEPNQPPWHTDDILSMTYLPPNILATGSVDGEIVLCNLLSGHLLHRLRPFDDDDIKSNPSVDKVVFLEERVGMLNAANLVSVGSDGIIRFWNTNYGYLMYEFEGGYAALRYASTSDSTLTNSQSISTLLSGGAGSSNSSKKPVSAESVSAMCTNLSNSILISADCAGWITVWDIRDTCIIDKGSQSLPVISVFQAHVASISNVEFLEQFDLILTASADSSARLFTLKGEYIGTFGQQDLWDLGDADTFQAMKPLDVLLAEIEETEDEVMYQKLKDMAMKIISSSTKKRGKIDLIKSGKDGAVIPNEVGKINAAKPKVGAETLGTDETQEEEEQPIDEMTKSIVPESDLLNGMSEFLNVDASGGGDKRSSKVDGMLIPPSSAPGGAMGAIGGEKFGGGINDLRFPIIKCSTPIGLVQTRVIRTADLLKRDYSTWYAKSQFAQDRQYRPAYLRKGDGKLINGGSGISGGGVNSSSNNKTGGKSGDVAGVKSGIYHFLKPVELTDINDVVFTVQKFAKNIKSRN